MSREDAKTKEIKKKTKSAYFHLAASVSSSLDVSFADDGCGEAAVMVVCVAATMPSILYYLTRMETKRRWSCHIFCEHIPCNMICVLCVLPYYFLRRYTRRMNEPNRTKTKRKTKTLKYIKNEKSFCGLNGSLLTCITHTTHTRTYTSAFASCWRLFSRLKLCASNEKSMVRKS